MKRGFPRPQMRVEKCMTNDPNTTGSMGYGEKWDDRTYPVPYTAANYISTLHSGRAGECVMFKRCFACGEPVEGDEVMVLRMTGKIFSESGPFHDKCATITAKLCPHIATGTKYTFARESWESVRDAIKTHYN